MQKAMVELVARGRFGHVHAMIVLSDGKVNPVSSEAAVIAASLAKEQDITVYVVGFGPSLDEDVLGRMASGADRYFPAADPLLVRSIYRELARRVPCPPEASWGRG